MMDWMKVSAFFNFCCSSCIDLTWLLYRSLYHSNRFSSCCFANTSESSWKYPLHLWFPYPAFVRIKHVEATSKNNAYHRFHLSRHFRIYPYIANKNDTIKFQSYTCICTRRDTWHLVHDMWLQPPFFSTGTLHFGHGRVIFHYQINGEIEIVRYSGYKLLIHALVTSRIFLSPLCDHIAGCRLMHLL